MSYAKGVAAEELAKSYLVRQGLKWVESRYRTKFGEIDLVMRDMAHLVFVEVRYRYQDAFGAAYESITTAKQRKLRLTAMHYLSYKKLHEKVAARFDVVSVQGEPPQIEWIRDAFY